MPQAQVKDTFFEGAPASSAYQNVKPSASPSLTKGDDDFFAGAQPSTAYTIPPDPRSATDVKADLAHTFYQNSGIPAMIEKMKTDHPNYGSVLPIPLSDIEDMIKAPFQVAGQVPEMVSTATRNAHGLLQAMFPDTYQKVFGDSMMSTPTAQETEQAAAAGGAVTSQLPAYGGMLKAGIEAPNGLAKTWASIVGPDAAEAQAAKHTVEALGPRTQAMRDQAVAIAPDLARRGITGPTESIFDNRIIQTAKADAAALKAAEDRMPEGKQMPFGWKQPVLDQIDARIAQLGDLPANKGAISQLQDVRGVIDKLPDNAAIKDVIAKRRLMDGYVNDRGGFKQASIDADRTNLTAHRTGGNALRQAISQADTGIANANRNFHISRAAADVVEDRQGASAGKIPMPTTTRLITDTLAGGLGGLPGVAAAEGGRFLWTDRGVRSHLASIAQNAADAVRTPGPAPLGPTRQIGRGATPLAASMNPISPAEPIAAHYQPGTTQTRTGRLLTSGLPLPNGGARTTPITPAEPITTPFASQVPEFEKTPLDHHEPGQVIIGNRQDGPTLSHVEHDPITGEPRKFTYIDPATGEKKSFTVEKQKVTHKYNPKTKGIDPVS